MKKIIVLLLVSIFLLFSCATGTDINEKNSDGSPIWITTLPESTRLYYGVGSAKLSNIQNSQSAADTTAKSNLAKQLESTIKEATGVYSNETMGTVIQAYEKITMEVVNVTMRGVKVEQRWTAGDGTVWSLVSFPIKDIDENMALEANNYKNKLIERKMALEDKKNEQLSKILAAETAIKVAQSSNIELSKEIKQDSENAIMLLKTLLAEFYATTSDELKNAVSSFVDNQIELLDKEIETINPEILKTNIITAFNKKGYDME